MVPTATTIFKSLFVFACIYLHTRPNARESNCPVVNIIIMPADASKQQSALDNFERFLISFICGPQLVLNFACFLIDKKTKSFAHEFPFLTQTILILFEINCGRPRRLK
jgi:hypothetical protein